MDFRTTTIEALAARVRAGEVSARELTTAALDNIERHDGRLRSFVAVDGEAALAAADAVDAAVAAGRDPGPLAGVPFGVKDVQDATGYVSTHGCTVLADGAPAASDSVIVARLKAAGAVVVGKTNTPEQGWTATTQNPLFGETANPWDLGRAPGGSSGASAAAVAAGLVPLATGSDGGGSVRIPGAICGLSVLKPSLGRIPNAGAEPPDWAFLSTPAPIVRQASDVAYVLDAVVGPHPADVYSLPEPVDGPWRVALDEPLRPLKVGWSPDLGYAQVDRDIASVCESAVGRLAAEGWEVVPLDRVFDADPVFDWQVLASTYFQRSMQPHRERWDELSPGFREALEWGEGLTALRLLESEDAASRMAWRLAEVFEQVDLIACPTVAGGVPRLGGDHHGTIDGEPARNWVQLTYGFNMTRSPAASTCAGFAGDGMPVGLQLVGPQRDDLMVLRALAFAEAVLAVDAVAPYPAE